MKNYLLVLIFFFTPQVFCHAQNNFEVTFGGNFVDMGFSIQQTIDDKFVIAGTTQTFANGDDDFYLALLDTNGTLLWTKSYGGSADESAYCVRQTSDSGFIVAGFTTSFGAGNADVYLVRTDKNGDSLWTKTFGGADYDYGYSVELSNDGGFILAGQESSTNGGIANAWILKTDAQGDTIWTNRYSLGAWTGSVGAMQRPDNNIVVYGDFANNITGLGDYDLFWIELDSLGNTVSSSMIEDTTGHDYAISIRPVIQSGYVLISEWESLSSVDIGSNVILLDSPLDTVWTKKVYNNIQYRDVTQTPDSGFACVGFTVEMPAGSNKLLITKLSKDGDSLWTKYYSGFYSAKGMSVDNTSDDSIVVCGTTVDSSGTMTDVYVIKSEGLTYSVPCLPAIISQPSDTSIFENYDGAFIVAAASHATGFRWQYDSSGVFVDLQNGGQYSGVDSDILYITAAPLSMDGFNYRCIVSSGANCQDTTIIVTLHVNTSVGIMVEDIPKNKIYPNPVSAFLKISGKAPDRFIIYDSFGKSVVELKGGSQIDVSFLTKGIYYLQIFYREKEETNFYKFLKN